MSNATPVAPKEHTDTIRVPDHSVNRLANRLNVSTRHIYELHSRGIIRGIKVGRILRFCLADVVDQLNEHNKSRA